VDEMTGKNITAMVAGIVSLLGITTVSADEALEGAWIVASWESLNEEFIEEAQPGIFIFTSKNYAIMYVNTDEERDGYDAEAGQNDDETLSAYATLTANAGGYTVEGNTFTTFAYVAKDPNYMLGYPANGVEHTFERDGNFLTISGTSGPNVSYTAELLRVDGISGSWESSAE